MLLARQHQHVSVMDEIRDPGLPFSVAMVAVGAMPAWIRNLVEAEERRQQERQLALHAEELAAVMRTDTPGALATMRRVVSATTTFFDEFADVYERASELDPKNATSVLAWRADQVSAQQAGLDRVASRAGRLSGPAPLRPTTMRFRGRPRRGRR